MCSSLKEFIVKKVSNVKGHTFKKAHTELKHNKNNIPLQHVCSLTTRGSQVT